MPTCVHLGNDREDTTAIQKVFLPLISKEKPENDERRELVTTCSKLVAVKMRNLVQQLGNNPNSVNSVVTRSDKDWWEMFWSCRAGLALCLNFEASHWSVGMLRSHWLRAQLTWQAEARPDRI